MNISVHNTFHEEHTPLALAAFIFPGGESHAVVDEREICGQSVWIDARCGTPSDWMLLLATLDAVRACKPRRMGLHIPYFPGARQDRRQSGTPLTVQIYADAIKRYSPDAVVVLDPHSDVLGACLPIVPLHYHDMLPTGHAGLVCPDAGAEKRVYAVANAVGSRKVYHARKHRDTHTGNLSGFSCDPLPHGGRYLVVDDICDGGGTFVGLADIGCPGASLDLWVSHGIFSKGLDLLAKKFGTIYTTDSFPSGLTHPQLNVTTLHTRAASTMRKEIGT